MNPQVKTDSTDTVDGRRRPGHQGLVCRNRLEARRQERRRSPAHGRGRQGRRPGRGVVRQAVSNRQQPRAPRRVGPRAADRAVPKPPAADPARSRPRDGRLARGHDAGTSRPAPISTRTRRSRSPCSTSWAKSATGACWSTRSTAAPARRSSASPPSSPRWRWSMPPWPAWPACTAASAPSTRCAPSAAPSKSKSSCPTWPAASVCRPSP